LEGLEISEIQYSQMHLENRYDSEFYQKIYVENEALLRRNSFALISDEFFVTDGEHGSVVEQESGIKYLTAENIKNGYVDISNIRYVNNEVDRKNARARVAVDDVLISIKGTLGAIGVAEDWLLPANMNRDVAILKPLRNKELSAVVALFLMSRYGILQSSRGGSGGVQQMITLERLRKFISPVFSPEFCLSLNERLHEIQQLRVQTQVLYTQAETLLLDTLGMADFSARHSGAGRNPDNQKIFPPSGDQNHTAHAINPLDSGLRRNDETRGNDGVVVNIKSFKDSFAATGRLDAEYYQPKYEQVMAHIAAQAHDTLSALVTIKKSIEPGSDEYTDDEQGLPFMRVADYSKFGVTPPQKKIRASFVAENKDKLDALMPKEGTILFSKDGSVGEAYCLREDANFITSGAVLHLTVRNTKKLLPDYLTLALNSKLVKMQAERDAGGSIILHWRVGEIESVVVPLADMPTQQKIAALVQQSFTLKAESERLLAVAKRAVEMAIEQDELAAMDYLEQQAVASH